MQAAPAVSHRTSRPTDQVPRTAEGLFFEDPRHTLRDAGNANGRLPDAMLGLHFVDGARSGRLGYYRAGSGRPMLLLHSINAAPSAFEMRPLFERAARFRQVYALDLPGFGTSERSARVYDVQLFVDAILDMLETIATQTGESAVDVVALSLSAEFAARAARAQPQRVRTLALITPTGFTRGAQKLIGPPHGTLEVPGLHRLLTFALWSRALYGVLVSRASIRYFLRRTYGADAVPQEMVDYAHATSHQPGARHAPFAFLSFRLFSADIRAVYDGLEMPVWLAHGIRGDFKDFSAVTWTRSRPNWRVEAFATGAMVHWERPDTYIMKLREFCDTSALASVRGE